MTKEQDDQADAEEESSTDDQQQADNKESEDESIETMSEQEQMLEQKLQHVPGDPKDFLQRKLKHISRSGDSPGQDKSDAPDRRDDKKW